MFGKKDVKYKLNMSHLTRSVGIFCIRLAEVM